MVIPFHDVNPTRRTPWVTRLLIAANVVVFLLTPAVTAVGLGAVAVTELCQAEAFFYQYGAVPAELIGNEQLPRVPTGEAVRGGCLLGPPDYEKVPVWSVLSAMFLHAGWLHLLGNLLFLYVFGNNVEDRFGHAGFLAFYLGAGYVAAYGFALGFPGTVTPMVGASGAVSGVLGAYLALYPRARVWSLVPFCLFLPLRLPAWLVLGSWFVLQYLYSVGYGAADGTVAYLAHVVGFVFGFLVALPWRRPRPRAPYRPGPHLRDLGVGVADKSGGSDMSATRSPRSARKGVVAQSRGASGAGCSAARSSSA